ncbi:MAG: alpha/beta hydrolase [Flavobacteriales bacterium]|nr:alpha/beta hydrolase [Flavobacteriales bacterium]
MHLNQKTNNGTGQEVLLVHGNSLDLGTYSAQLNARELAHLRLIAIDLPGHGGSEPFPTNKNYTLENMAEKVADLVRSMNDPVLVGHSLGGHLCMRVLAQVKNVRALVLFGSPPLPVPRPMNSGCSTRTVASTTNTGGTSHSLDPLPWHRSRRTLRSTCVCVHWSEVLLRSMDRPAA